MKTYTQQAETFTQNRVAEATKHLEFIHANREILEKLNLRFNLWSDHRCDFDNLARPDLLRVLKAFPGTWDKAPGFGTGGIHYTLVEKVSGFIIRCYNGEPPPSCEIIETVEYEEIPARVERVVKRTVKCPEPLQ